MALCAPHARLGSRSAVFAMNMWTVVYFTSGLLRLLLFQICLLAEGSSVTKTMKGGWARARLGRR